MAPGLFPFAVFIVWRLKIVPRPGHARFVITTKNQTQSAQEFGRYPGVSGNRIGCGLLAFSARRCFVFLGCGFALSVWRAGVFAWVLPVFSMVGGAAGMPLAGFLRFSDTPVEPFVRNGFGVVGVVSGCVVAGRRVCLSLAAQHGGLAPGGRGGLLVRWWFENSRAYLYYFFYKSMIASPSSASLGGVAGRP